MKIIYVNVEALPSEAEKIGVQESFEKLGWDSRLHLVVTKDLIPTRWIDYFEFTWYFDSEPRYPVIPDACILTSPQS